MNRRLLSLTVPLVLLATSALAGDLEDAKALQKAGKFEQALPKYEAAAKADPKNAEAALGLSQVLAGLGRFEEASKAVDSARKAHPGNGDLLVAKARACLLAATKMGEAEEPDANRIDAYKLDAMKWVDEALKADPKCSDALVFRGQILRRETSDDPAVTQKNEDQAVMFFEEALKADPQNFDASFELADIWYERGQKTKDQAAWAKAGQYYDAAAKIDPKSGKAALGVARMLGRNKAPPKDVVNAYLKAADLMPDDWNALLQAYTWCPRSDRVTRFQVVADALPKNVKRKIFYAYALKEDKQFDKAVAVLAEAAAIEPKNPDIYINEGDTHLARGSQGFDQAMVAYEKAMEIFHGRIDNNTFDSLVSKGLNTVGLHPDQREKLWTMLWKNFPDKYALANNLGLYYRDRIKDYKKSVEWYHRAAEVATEDACVQNDIGLMYHYQQYGFEDFAKAEGFYRRAIEIGKEQGYDFNSTKDPDRGYTDALNNLGTMLITQKRWADLKAFCEKDVPAGHRAREAWLKRAEEQK